MKMVAVSSAAVAVCLLIILPLDVDGQGEDMCLQPLAPNCTSCVDPGLDLSTDCTTCQQGPIECTPGEQDCGVGHFTFSALFHSYSNPNELCGECGENGETITCGEANPNPSTTCRFRFIYCLQPFGSPAQDVFFQVQQPPERLSGDERSFTFEEGFIVKHGTINPNFWNRSNPFTRELQTWPGKVQLYIIVYHIPGSTNRYVVVDRVPIDLELGISSDFTERRTYSGIHNISQFDMSFRLSGQCAEGYTGPWCNVLCSELEVPADDTQDNCQGSTDPGTGAVIGGVVGGVLGMILLVLVLLVLIGVVLFMQKRQGQGGSQPDPSHELSDNPMYDIKELDPNTNPASGSNGRYTVPGPQEYATIKEEDSATTPVIYSEIKEGQTYSVPEPADPSAHKFENPIYGDEFVSNEYSHALLHSEAVADGGSSQPPHHEYSSMALEAPGYHMTEHSLAGQRRQGTQNTRVSPLANDPASDSAVYSKLEDQHTYSVPN